MSDDWSFNAIREEHFDPLCRALNLTDNTSRAGRGFAVLSAAAGNVRVFFEHERGLCHFSVASNLDEMPLCSIEDLAARFPRIRLLGEGHQRLSLVEQREFVEGHWNILQTMFSQEHLKETRAWHAAAMKAQMEKYSHRG